MDEMDEQIRKLQRVAQEQGILAQAVVINGDGGSKDRRQYKLPTDNRELHDFARDMGKECCASTGELFSSERQRLFRRDMAPMIVNTEKKRLDPMTAELFRTWMSSFVACYREKKTNDITLRFIRTMNLDTARGTLESHELLLQASRIERINETRLPVITNDGRIDLLRPGYYAERGIYTFDDGLTIDEAMSLEEARSIIDALLKYFPFANPRSKAVAIAAMLTLFCASMLPARALRPGFIFTANSTGAGKTLLAKIPIITLVGFAATRTFPRKEEQKKVLDIFAMQAASYIFFDNIRGKIAGEDIEQFITSPVVKGRVLGESTEFVVDNVATVFMTGNQSTTSADMADRCLFVELFVEQADTRDRKIPPAVLLDDTILAEPGRRAKTLSAMYAFVRAWDAADRPTAPSVLPRFEAWSRVVASIVEVAGYGDPVARLKVLGDEELQDMRELVQELAPNAEDLAAFEAREDRDPDELPHKHWKFAEIVERVTELGLFSDIEVRSGKSYEQMFDDNGVTPAGKSHFGKLLVRYDRRLFSVRGRALRFLVEGKGNSRRYSVEIEKPVERSEPF